MIKKSFTLQNKIMFAIMFVLVSFFFILSYLYYAKDLRENEIQVKMVSANTKTSYRASQNSVTFQNNIVKDYAVWDEMKQNVLSRNTVWIKQNTEPLLKTYGQDDCLVYDASLTYLCGQPQGRKLLSPEILGALEGQCGNFYILDDAIPVHVTWSIITTTSDTGRKLLGSGYLFILKYWDSAFVSSLSENAGLSLFFGKPFQKSDLFLESGFTLHDVHGNIVLSLYFVQDDFVAQLHRRTNMMFFVAVLCICVVFFVFWLIIRKYVTKPIDSIHQVLTTGKVSDLEFIKLSRFHDEWNMIAALVEDNINKNEELFKTTQELLKTTEELKHEIQTKDQFFDLIAHDLTTPFNGIIGLTQLLLESSESFSEEEKKTLLQSIFQSSRSSYKLLKKLLDWARLQTGRWNPIPKSFEINKLIDVVVSFHQASAIQKKVDLIVDTKDTFFVMADENMLEAALRNIISNAIKFTQPYGFVKIHLQQQDKAVIVTITDSGKGMSSNILNSLFKIGKKVVSEDVSGNIGTGLGLILCKEFVEKNNGRIWVESELEKGSAFHFSVPLSS
jgi:signal transduction histidine kinase